MGLVEYQKALARLYTDEQFRSAFVENPTSESLSIGLNADETANLVRLTSKDSKLQSFADSLIAKRRCEITKMLPFTRLILSNDFPILFRDFANNHRFNGVRKHQKDAIGFARWISSNRNIISNELNRELVRYEADALEASVFPKLIQVKFYRYPVDKILQTARRGGTFNSCARPTIIIWFMISGTTRLRQVSLRMPSIS